MAVQSKTMKAGEILFNEGDVSRDVYIVKSGLLKIIKKPNNSPAIELAQMRPGMVFGEMAFFDGEPRSATAVAAMDSEVHILPAAALETHFNSQPAWMVTIIKAVVDRLRTANQRIKELEKSVPRITY